MLFRWFRSNPSFRLVELLVVIAIIAVLLARLRQSFTDENPKVQEQLEMVNRFQRVLKRAKAQAGTEADKPEADREAAPAEPRQFPLRAAYDHLFKGKYEDAIEEAEKVIRERRDDPTLTSRAINIVARSLVFMEKEEEAFAKLGAYAKEFENDDQLYSESYPVPSSLHHQLIVGQEKVFVYRRNLKYDKAAEAVKKQIALQEKGNEFRGEGKGEMYVINLISLLGDLYRYDRRYDLAILCYEKALDRLKVFPPLPNDVCLPQDQYLKKRLPRLIELCGEDVDKVEGIDLAKSVDFVREVADWHMQLVKQYNSPGDVKLAAGMYKECLAFLAARDLSGLSERLRKKYEGLKEELPKRIEDIEKRLRRAHEKDSAKETEAEFEQAICKNRELKLKFSGLAVLTRPN